jgi:D-lactate dehydrogenase (cytochrome)
LTIEYFDRFALELLAPEYARIPEKAQAALYIEQVAHKTSDDTVLEFIDTIIEEFRTIPFSTWIADTDKDREYIREFRHRLPEKVNELVSRNGQPKVGTDLAVPQKHFKEMMQRYVTVLGSTELPYLIFGHIGECHMHANILPATNEQCASAKAAYSILVDHALSLGGTVSAEHGIGKTKHSFLKQMLKEHGIAELARIRAIFDPAGILNPGNLYPAKQ